MIWYLNWNWHENKYIEKRKQGIVLYEKPKNEHLKPFKDKILNRRLQTNKIMTHGKK